jgi:hypothetical protein
MDVFGLSKIFDDFKKKVLEELGIEQFEKDVTNFMTESLSAVANRLGDVNIESIVNAIKMVVSSFH